MTDSSKRATWWTAAILLASVVVAIGLFHLGAPIEPLSLWIVSIGAPATTLFVILYGVTVRWWEFWIGRALMVSSTGMALLVDIALLNRILPPEYPLQQELLLTLLVFISAGGVLKLLALLVDKVPLWLGRRGRRTPESAESRDR